MAQTGAANQAGLQPRHDGLSKTLSRLSNYGRKSDSPIDLDKQMPYVPKVVPSIPNILPSSDKFGDPYELGDAYESLIKRSVWAIPSDEQKPYLKYLKNISDGFPHIRWLADFMEVGTYPYKWKFLSKEDIENRAKITRVAMLDLFPDKDLVRRDFQKSEKLTRAFEDPFFNHDPEHARIFIVEDLSRDVIEAFGAQYDIDPLFFQSHISDYLWYNTRDPWVELPDLSHIGQERNYFNIRYMTPKYFKSQESIETAIGQLGAYNVLRRVEQELSWKVREMRKIKGSSVGVIRSKASLWIRKNKPGENGILAILVLDPTLQEGYKLWGGPRNSQPCPSMHSPVIPPPPINSLFENIIQYTLRISKNDISSILSSPHTLGVPILSLIAAEWLTVVTYITTTLTKIEYELENAQYRDSSTGLTGALDRLHPLRRLMPVYRNMIMETLTTILNSEHPLSSLSDSTHSPLLKKLHGDFTTILDAIDSLQIRTQNIISLATTIISIEENQRAMKMNVNLVRVTYLAVIFVPMAFVSSFFSMTPDLAAIEKTVWVYFAVAIPLTVLCVAAADPKRVMNMWRSGVAYVRGRR